MIYLLLTEFVVCTVSCGPSFFSFDFMRNGLKFLKHVERKTSQFEIVFKSLAHFNT